MITNTINQSFTEVYNIITHMDKKLYDKIPKSFIEMLENCKDYDYEVNIDYSKSINEQELLHETRAILSLIYRDYICTPEKRKELVEEDNEELKKEEEILQGKYNIDFNKRTQMMRNKNTEDERKIKNTYMVEVKKEKWYEKIINKIKSFFKGNKMNG